MQIFHYMARKGSNTPVQGGGDINALLRLLLDAPSSLHLTFLDLLALCSHLNQKYIFRSVLSITGFILLVFG